MSIIELIVILLFLHYSWMATNGNYLTRDQITKNNILEKINTKYPEHVLQFKVIEYNSDCEEFQYPVIFKPTKFARGGNMVKKINNSREGREYLATMKNKLNKVIVQEYHPGPYEVGLLYRRLPGRKRCYIDSLVLKNGSTIRCGNQCRCGCEYKPEWITPELINSINNIMTTLPNFHYGRFDIRFESIPDFIKGKGFKIVELNGTMSFDLRLNINRNNPFYRISVSFKNILLNLLSGIYNITTGHAQRPDLYIISLSKMKYDYDDDKDYWEIFGADWD